VSTFLFEPRFLGQREAYLDGEKGLVLKGVIELAVPCHLRRRKRKGLRFLTRYYGNEKEVKERCVMACLEAIAKTGKSRKACRCAESISNFG